MEKAGVLSKRVTAFASVHFVLLCLLVMMLPAYGREARFPATGLGSCYPHKIARKLEFP